MAESRQFKECKSFFFLFVTGLSDCFYECRINDSTREVENPALWAVEFYEAFSDLHILSHFRFYNRCELSHVFQNKI